MTEFLSEIGNSITSVIGDGVGGVIQNILYNTIYRLMYYIVAGICWLLQLLYEMLEIFSGITKITYNEEPKYLIEVFFGNSAVTNAYWGMALIGIVCCIGFTIFAVSKKMFGLDGQEKSSLGAVLGNMFKSMMIILSLSAIMVITISATNTMFQTVNKLFITVQSEPGETTISFNDEQYATMARVLNTIGNYSLSPASSSRYNINSCYNDIRADMNQLSQQMVFNYTYDAFKVKVDGEYDKDGTPVTVIKQYASWQRSLKTIANAADLTQDLKMDAYNESVATAITNVMNEIRKNPSFRPLAKYERIYVPSERIPIDRLLFLLGTLRGANNAEYNVSPSITDSVRGAYYTGTKDIYNFETVTADFDIGIGGYDYIIVVFGALALLWAFINMIITFIQRIFFMLTLYIIAPPAIATMPMDNGEKFKQWTSSFVIQCLSVFGTLITMHLFLLFMPIIFDSGLVLFEDILLNLIGKLMLLIGGAYACKSANTLITSLLSGNAGFNSASLSDHNESATQGVGMAGKTAMAAGGLAYAGTKMAVKGGAMATVAGATGVYQGFQSASGFIKNEMPKKMQRMQQIAKREWQGIKEMAGDFKNQFTGYTSGSGATGGTQARGGSDQAQIPPKEQVGSTNQPQSSFQPQSQAQSSFQPQSQAQSSFQPQSRAQSSFQPQSQTQNQVGSSVSGNVTQPSATPNTATQAKPTGYSSSSLDIGSGGGVTLDRTQNKPIPPSNFKRH